ncbi:hypothetical protein [Variovorax paradoxus]|jgi:hypothetical protein|uniref:hypothetical protein n=1 Tax=Variovorax paradoxus TaxID=34073 RepID=UPI0030D52BD5
MRSSFAERCRRRATDRDTCAHECDMRHPGDFGENAAMPPKDARPGLRISPFTDRLAHKAAMVANVARPLSLDAFAARHRLSRKQVGWASGSYLSRMLGRAWAATAAQIRASAQPRG